MGKTLGILGGMGPLATVKLFETIVNLTDAGKDQDHLHILIDNNSLIADRTSYILNQEAEDPRPRLIESAKRLEDSSADFLIMPCNTAHYFYKDIVDQIHIPFLNMIEETAKYLKANHPSLNKVGLLATEGTIKAKVYDQVFSKYNIEVLLPSSKNQKYVSELIYNIKEGKDMDSLDGFYGAMEELKDLGSDLYIAACTEISVALELYKLEGNFIDPLRIIAISAIEFSGGKIK